jgi:hypothetical protein
MSTFQPVEETWIDQRKGGGTKTHHDRTGLEGLYPVDGGGGGAIFKYYYYYYYYYYCCFISLLQSTHYMTTFFVCNFVAVFAVAVQNTLSTHCGHLFMSQFSTTFTCLSPLVLYIHQTEN